MNNAVYDDARGRLEQIADALGIPVATFFTLPHEPVTEAAVAEQEEELLRLFRKVRDAEIRWWFLETVRAAADQAVA